MLPNRWKIGCPSVSVPTMPNIMVFFWKYSKFPNPVLRSVCQGLGAEAVFWGSTGLVEWKLHFCVPQASKSRASSEGSWREWLDIVRNVQILRCPTTFVASTSWIFCSLGQLFFHAVVWNISSSFLYNGLNATGGEENGKNGKRAKPPLRFAQEALSLGLLLGTILPKLFRYALSLMCCYCYTSEVSPLISLCFAPEIWIINTCHISIILVRLQSSSHLNIPQDMCWLHHFLLGWLNFWASGMSR